MNEDTGGPAFPFAFVEEARVSDGMTLRDYFAAKVLPQCLELCSTHSRAAEEAYLIADAMLEARK